MITRINPAFLKGMCEELFTKKPAVKPFVSLRDPPLHIIKENTDEVNRFEYQNTGMAFIILIEHTSIFMI